MVHLQNISGKRNIIFQKIIKKGKDYASKSKKPYRLNYKKSKRKSKDIIICHKCGRNGHTANNCYLNVFEDLKEQIRKIILNTDSDSDESISDFQTNDLNILENTTSSSEDSDICECIGKCHCNNLINVITSSIFKNKNIEINNEEENKIENVTIGKLINNQVSQKLNTQITLVKDNFKINLTALIDSGVDMNCIQEGIFPTQFYEKTTSTLIGAGANQLNDNNIQNKITGLKLKFEKNVCSNIPNAFWNRKQHIVKLPYIKKFNEKDIPSKSRAIHMNNELESHCKNEIQDLINKKLIRPSKSPWSCSTFYVMNVAKLERGSPRLVINYKPLNKVLEWIRYPISNKRNLLKKFYDSKIFSKFDMKSGFWQIQLHEEDKYKTGFKFPLGILNGM
uniref:CCHC-type domain-containing protein n=1 Tax=Lactuca sativa TaxID=4236 RepID=A0A9R1V1E1_LACSA|nr:hypothetical protein LSAT_V11C700382540 [Lactuca sativa]